MAINFFPFQKKSEEKTSQTDETIRALEEKIRSAEAEKNRIFSILGSLSEGVMIVGTDQKVALMNAALLRSFGLKKETVEGRYFWESFRDADLNQSIENCLKGRTALKKEHAVPLSSLIFEIQISPVFSGRDFLGIAAVFHDVTRLKELERLRSEFVANVSHEFKTPLTSILGFLETLKDGAIEDPKNRVKFLQIIEDHSKKLQLLIENLLLLSKIESGAETLRREKLDLGPMLDKLFESFGSALKEKKIQVEKEFPVKPFFVDAEAVLLERVISNLLDNAIKYNIPGGKIVVKTSEDAAASRIEIRDSGIGISAADQPRIFERFYRADKSRSRESGGTGLGLSIAKHIIERHGGRIEVQSRLQEGSIFTVIFPKSPK